MERGPLTYAERMVFEAICAAAEAGQTCPSNNTILDMTGYNAAAMAPLMVAKLEERGLIRVDRRQRCRIVEVVATGKRTAVPAGHSNENPHVPKRGKAAPAHLPGRI